MKKAENIRFDRKYGVKRRTISEPRLRAPTRIGGWVQGFLNGRTGTAATGQDGAVHSGYLEAALAQYRAYAAKKRECLIVTITSCCAELRELLCSFPAPRAGSPKSVEEIRAAQRVAAAQGSILCDMIRLDELLAQSVERYDCDLEAAARKVSRGIACYCKGVLFRKPVHPAHLPEVETPQFDWSAFPEQASVIRAVHRILEEYSTNEKEGEPA